MEAAGTGGSFLLGDGETDSPAPPLRKVG